MKLTLFFLEKVKPESNSIITKWNELGLKPKNAMQTQALLELKNNYCKKLPKNFRVIISHNVWNLTKVFPSKIFSREEN